MDIGIIIAISAATFTIVGVVISMMFWTRSEINDVRKEFVNVVNEMRSENKEFHNAISLENKDFHYRLLEIEKTRKVIIRSPE